MGGAAYEAVLAALPQPVWSFCPAGRPCTANPAAEAVCPAPASLAALLLELAPELPADSMPPLTRRLVNGTLQLLERGDGGVVVTLLPASQRASRAMEIAGELRTGVLIYSPEGRLAFANAAYEAMLGFAPGTLPRGITEAELLRLVAPHLGYQDIEATIAARAALDRSQAFAFEGRGTDGRSLLVEGQPLPDGGELLEVHDITAQRVAEAERAQHAALLDGVLASLPHGVVVFDAEDRVAMVNAAYHEIMVGAELTVGETRETIARRRAMAGEYGPGGVETLVAAALAPARVERRPRLRLRPNGTAIAQHYAALPDGGLVQVSIDVTALHAARAEADARASQLQAMLDTLRHGVALYGPDRRLIAFNHLCVELGRAPAEAVRIGASIEAVLAAGVASGGMPGTEAERLLDRYAHLPFREERRSLTGRIVEVSGDATPDGGFVLSWVDVTDRALAEQAAAERAAMLRVALEAMHHGLILYGPDRRVIAANQLAESLCCLAPGGLTPGMRFEELVQAQLAGGGFGTGPDTAAIAARIIAADRRLPQGARRHLADGRIIETHSEPLADGGFVISFSDITALATAEAAARERATVLQNMLDHMRHGIVIFGPDHRVVLANVLGEALPGVPPGSVRPGRPLAELIDTRLALEAAAGLASDGVSTRRDRSKPYRWTRAAPGGRMLDITSDPLPDGGFVICFVDQTELTAAQRTAQRQSELMRTMQDAIRHGIALFDAEGRLVLANRLAAPLSGVAPEDLRPGMTTGELAEVQFARGVFGSGPEALATRDLVRRYDRRRSFPVRRPMPDGRVVDSVSDPTPEGGFVITWTDVTAQLEAEAEAQTQAATRAVMLDVIRHGIMLFGPDRRLIAANRLVAELSGAPESALVPGATHAEVTEAQIAAGVFDGDPDGVRAARERLAADRSKPLRYQRRLGDGRLIEVVSDPTPDGGFAITYSDVTALAAAEAEAASRSAMLQTALDGMRHGLMLVGPDRRLLLANRLASPIYGIPDLEGRMGDSFEAILEDQAAAGIFGAGAEGAALYARIRDYDRSRPVHYRRSLADGRVIEVRSDPTPDGGWVLTHSEVTELARAEAVAAARAAALQTTLETMRHGLAQYDAAGVLVTTNALAAELCGIRPEQAQPGMTTREIAAAITAGDAFEPMVMAAELQRDRSKPSREVRRRRDGRVIEVQNQPMTDGGFVITFTDITALSQAEAAANERASVLRVMLDNMRHGIAYFDRDHRLVAANALIADLAGDPGGALPVGVSIDELFARQVAARRLGPEGEAVAGQAASFDRAKSHRYLRSDGQGRQIAVTSEPAPDGGFVVTMTDVTALVAAEADARRRAGILQLMLDTLRHAIVMFDEHGCVMSANRVFVERMGVPAEIVVPGTPNDRLIDWLAARGEYGDGEAGRTLAATVKGRDRSLPARYERLRPTGETLEVISEPLPGGGWLMVFTDVSEERAIRTALEQARAAAETANRAKSRFLATMTHELRTPLNAVIGFSEALTADPDPGRGRDYIRSILESGRHLLSLIDDILDVARAETGGFTVTLDEVELLPIAEVSVRVLQATAATAGVTLHGRLPTALPLLRADEVRLRQVLLNLLSNAVKFTPEGGTVTLSVEQEPASGDLVLRVSDTGIGVPPEEIPKVFEPFTQLDSTLARRFRGSGLGLYLSRALAEAQGASLTLESAVGQGTTAVLRFPKSSVIDALAA